MDFSIFQKRIKIFSLALFFDNIEGEIEGIIWPIFVFLVLKDIISVGGVAFFVSIGAMIFSVFVGRYYDRKSKYLFLRVGGVLFAAVWILRAFYDSQVFIFVSSFIAGFLTLMVSISFESIFYEKAAKDEDANSFIVYREVPTFFGRVFLWSIALIFVGSFEGLFLIAGICYLVLSFLKFEGIAK